ncbi:MAG TPA: hypothetical protein VGX92_13145 [Pyrinomonadaceae bacterium]|jgi:hypothetical protein|nr:hypothetical protein [Pyrinomonadaceae bacterium]
MKKLIAVSTLSMVAAIGLTACDRFRSPAPQGNSRAAASPSRVPIPDACSILSAEEAAEALGVSKVEGRRMPSANYCSYGAGADGALYVEAFQSSPSELEAHLESYRKNSETHSLNGIGDRAYIVDATKTIFVLKGNMAFSIGINKGEQNVPTEKLKSLAIKVLPRLP